MPDADIIVEKDWATVVNELRLGSTDGETALFRLFDPSGEDVIRMSHRPEIHIDGDDGRTVLRDDEFLTGYINADDVYVSGGMSSRTGIVQDLQLGGGTLSEDDDGSGQLDVQNEQGSVTVAIDGQEGSIRHTGGVSRMSDARVKQDVDGVEGALDTVSRLRGVRYEWDDDAFDDLTDLDDDRHVGFVAQEVAAVLPEAVDVDAAGRLGTVDDAFTPLLVEAIKEQQSLIQAQDDRIASLEARLDALETAVDEPTEPAG